MDIYKICIKVFVVLNILFFETHGFKLLLHKNQDEGSYKLTDSIQLQTDQEHYLSYPSVHHYARHSLCMTFKRRKHFYKAMKTHLCGISLSFSANLVTNLCRHRNKMLDKWVTEIFDLNRDGRISHFERRFYLKDNS